jgi:hypothetical protein
MGQSNMLLCMKTDKPAHINVSAVWELPPGTDLDRIAETLAALHARHETLRTTFPAGPNDPEPRQVVHAEGELEIQLYPAPDDDSDVAPFAQELALRLRAIAYDPAADWPVRAAVVTAGGAPTHLALAASHAALDAGALVLLRRDWDALLAAEPLPEPADVQPTDLALLERSDEGRRRSASSLDYWTGQLRGVEPAVRVGQLGTLADAARQPFERLSAVEVHRHCDERVLRQRAQIVGEFGQVAVGRKAGHHRVPLPGAVGG